MPRFLQKPFVTGATLLSCFAFLTGCGIAQLGSLSRAEMRTPIELSVKEQEHLRFEMRKLLESVEGITGALAENKMELVARNAEKAGMGMVDDAAISIALKLTTEFVALYATEDGTKTGALKQLSAALATCTACHAAYRISPK
jgi:hypothetical protein